MPASTKRSSVVEPIRELNRIKVVDNGEPLVRIVGRCPEITINDEPHDLGFPRIPYLRETVVEMLATAQEALPKGHHFMVTSAYRAPEHQRAIYQRVYNQFKESHPEWPENILRRETNRFVHPPDIPTPPGHCTGGAVDLTIIGPDGEELDMVSPYNGDREVRRNVAATYDEKISARARKNRAMLIELMESVAFTNYAGEWWHYSFGDSCWAWRIGADEAIYDIAEPTPEIRRLIDSAALQDHAQ